MSLQIQFSFFNVYVTQHLVIFFAVQLLLYFVILLKQASCFGLEEQMRPDGPPSTQKEFVL